MSPMMCVLLPTSTASGISRRLYPNQISPSARIWADRPAGLDAGLDTRLGKGG
jgi:hypothetical protein